MRHWPSSFCVGRIDCSVYVSTLAPCEGLARGLRLQMFAINFVRRHPLVLAQLILAQPCGISTRVWPCRISPRLQENLAAHGRSFTGIDQSAAHRRAGFQAGHSLPD
jgi:hypothetical protein